MQSSSQLFPVSLMAADFVGDLHEDIYQLNPQVSPDASLRLSVTRVTDPARHASRVPLILVHNEFHNRRQWLTPTGKGLAARLAEAGFDVWLPEMRGHGLSPGHDRWASNTLSTMATEDWPAVQAFVAEQSGRPPVWVGFGLGGLSASYALIHVPEMASDAAGLVLIDAASAHWQQALRTLRLADRWRVRRQGYVDGPELKWGVEREPLAQFQEQQRWQRLRRKGRHPVFDQLGSLDLPVGLVSVRDSEKDVLAIQRACDNPGLHWLKLPAAEGRTPRGPLGSGRGEGALVDWLASGAWQGYTAAPAQEAVTRHGSARSKIP